MQDIEQLPLQQWAEQLKQARGNANLDINTLAQTLMLSSAQLRGLENGSLSAFHGPGYYLRAVEKYARQLDIILDPPVTELRLTDSQIALNRVKNQPSADKLAKRESRTLGIKAMPRSHGGSRIGVWLGGLLIVLVGAGTWMAISEGWPGRDGQKASTEPDNNVLLETAPVPQSEPSVNETVSLAPPENPPTEPSEPRSMSPVDKSSSTSSQEAVIPKPETTAEPAPAPEPAAAPAPPPAPDVIQAQFNAECWVEVRFADGRVEQGIYKPGQVFKAPVTDITRLTFGNAQAVNAKRAGDTFDVLAFTRGGNNVARISAADLQKP